jgi:hypothetical protein
MALMLFRTAGFQPAHDPEAGWLVRLRSVMVPGDTSKEFGQLVVGRAEQAVVVCLLAHLELESGGQPIAVIAQL